ncbi:MAG TPA: motility protein A [Anaerolineaceae bacterium]|nr:motility protein A [Anaerolineaceae bacterium]
MDLASIVGLIGVLAILVVVLIMDGGSPAELLAHPSAILLTLGGSLAATTITTSLQTFLSLPKLLIHAFTSHKVDISDSIEMLVRMADKARKEGLLALEEESRNITDEFLQKGLMMVVDGVDPSQVRTILETTIEQMASRHRVGYSFFQTAGGFSPTFGIIGTVMGLISVLKQLDDPNALATSIAAAFLATLWGLLSANMIYLPIGGKLKEKSREEVFVRYLQMEGILAIQAGENPNIIREKLYAYLPPKLTRQLSEAGAAQQSSASTQQEAGA